MKIVKKIQPPTGLRRFAFRMPVYLYRLKLGWLFGHRLLLLNHIGRVTGKPRETILEVAGHDAADGSYVVASGWGPTAAWYRNILQSPDVTIEVGTRTIPATAVPLGKEDASRHRTTAKYVLPRVLGFSVDGSDTDFRAVGQQLPFVRFVRRSRNRASPDTDHDDTNR